MESQNFLDPVLAKPGLDSSVIPPNKMFLNKPKPSKTKYYFETSERTFLDFIVWLQARMIYINIINIAMFYAIQSGSFWNHLLKTK